MSSTGDSGIGVSAAPSGPSRIWLFAVGVCLVGTYASMFIPALEGQDVEVASGYGSMFWSGLFFFLWWKRRSKSASVGAFIGVAVGVIAFAAAAFLRGAVGHA